MGDGSAYAYIAMKEAIKNSGLEEKDISNIKTGIIIGSGGPSIKNVIHAVDTTRKSSPKKMELWSQNYRHLMVCKSGMRNTTYYHRCTARLHPKSHKPRMAHD